MVFQSSDFIADMRSFFKIFSVVFISSPITWEHLPVNEFRDLREEAANLWTRCCKHRWWRPERAGGGWTLPLCSQVDALSPITSAIRCSRVCFNQKPAAVMHCCKNVEWVPVLRCRIRMINVCSDKAHWCFNCCTTALIHTWNESIFGNPVCFLEDCIMEIHSACVHSQCFSSFLSPSTLKTAICTDSSSLST